MNGEPSVKYLTQSVTTRGQKPFYLLQIKTKENVQAECLNL